MKTFISKKNSEVLHILYNVYYSNGGRVELTDSHDELQVSVIDVLTPLTIAPHFHGNITRTTNRTVETWIVMAGKGTVELYDIDKTLIETVTLSHGDVLVTLAGGHALKTGNMIMVECKNGPYFNTKVSF